MLQLVEIKEILIQYYKDYLFTMSLDINRIDDIKVYLELLDTGINVSCSSSILYSYSKINTSYTLEVPYNCLESRELFTDKLNEIIF